MSLTIIIVSTLISVGSFWAFRVEQARNDDEQRMEDSSIHWLREYTKMMRKIWPDWGKHIW